MPKTPLFSSPRNMASLLYNNKSSLNCCCSSSSSPRSMPSPRKLHVSPSSPPPRQPSVSPLTVDTVLKRKRPARIAVPAISSAAVGFESLREERVEAMEEEGDGYSVYCKRGRRRSGMEDRFSASVGIHGDSRQVLGDSDLNLRAASFCFFFISICSFLFFNFFSVTGVLRSFRRARRSKSGGNRRGKNEQERDR